MPGRAFALFAVLALEIIRRTRVNYAVFKCKGIESLKNLMHILVLAN